MTLPTTVELLFETEAIAMHPTKIAFLRMVSLMLGVVLNFIFTGFDKLFDLLTAVNPAIPRGIESLLPHYIISPMVWNWFPLRHVLNQPYRITGHGFFRNFDFRKNHHLCGLAFTDCNKVFRFIYNFLNLLSGYYDSSTNGELWNSAILLDLLNNSLLPQPLVSAQAAKATQPSTNLATSDNLNFITTVVNQTGPAVVRIDSTQTVKNPQASVFNDPLFREFFGSGFPKVPSNHEHKSKQLKSENIWIGTIKTIIFSLIIALGIRTFIAETRYVPSGSMEPTIQPGDRLIIDKISYNFTFPQRGDIVVFNPTKTLQQDNFHDAFVKRAIGLPGDKVEVKNGQVYINALPIKENYIEAKPDYNWGSVIVPANSYLVLGDNRNDSFDSHYWGFVPRNKIIGRAILFFWPLNRVREIQRPVYIFN